MSKRIALANFTIKEYMRGTWLSAETVLIVSVMFLYSHYYWKLEAHEVFLALGVFSIIIAILTTLRVSKRELNPRIYIMLTKAITRKDYICGKIIAILAIDIIFLLVLFIIGFSLTKLGSQLSLGGALVRFSLNLPVLLLAEMITMLFSPMIISKTAVPFGLTLTILGLYQPSEILKVVLPPFRQLIKATYSNWGNEFFYDVFLSTVYLILFWYLINYLFDRREIDFEPK